MSFDKILNDIEEKAYKNSKINDGDYKVDGLLYCGKCNTPKQCRVEVFGKIRTPYCLCKCEEKKRDIENENVKHKAFLNKVNQLRKMGFPDEELKNCKFSRDDKANPKASGACYKYAKNFNEILKKGKGLVINGSVGSGKTFLAASIANELIDKGYPCLVTNFSRLTNTLTGMYEGKQAYIDGLNKFDLLVIDDFAAERDTEYMNEIIYNIIDSRYRSGKPMIITTNLDTKDLFNATDIKKQRIYSRILEMCVPLSINGEDRRKNQFKKNHYELGEILKNG